MTRKPAESAVARARGSIASRDRRLVGAVLASLLSLVAPLSASAKPQAESPSMTVTIDVSTRDCNAVRIDYHIEWQGFSPDSGFEPSLISLFAKPDSFLLTNVDFGKKADKSHGKVRGQLIRESGYFDHQTYPGLAYQVIVSSSDNTIDASSDPVTIPDCLPMSPTRGPSAGGTVVTVAGGGAPGGTPFSGASVVFVSGQPISPTEFASDGTWLRFVTPPGDPGACVDVFVDGMTFPLPAFCYET